MNIESVEIGQEVDPFTVESVDPEKMKIMAAILRDPNPIHFDVEAVRELEMGDRVVNQGPINLSYLANMLAQWAGGAPAIRSLQVRFIGNVFANDRVECRGRVTEVDRSEGIVTVEVEARTPEQVVLSGTAVISA